MFFVNSKFNFDKEKKLSDDKSCNYNMNCQVANPDKDDYWVPNNGSGTQVPE